MLNAKTALKESLDKVIIKIYQTVNKENGRYYRLIKKFYKLCGIPCILNTSFNFKGEPIVENPSQALKDFLRTQMDYLVIGDFLISKRVKF